MVSCTECERNFTNSRGMKVHRAKTHDVYVEDINEYDCPTCNKKLPTERGMKVHHKRKHNESLVYEEKECKHCSEAFKAHMNGKVHCSKECANKSISESLMGENNPNYGKKRPNVMQKIKEGRQEWLENMSNEEREVWKNKIGQNIQEWWDDESVDHSKRNEKVSKAKAKHMVDSNLNYYVYGKELPADEYFMFSELDKLVEVTT